MFFLSYSRTLTQEIFLLAIEGEVFLRNLQLVAQRAPGVQRSGKKDETVQSSNRELSSKFGLIFTKLLT